MNSSKPRSSAMAQIEKFKEAARELETDDREDAFDEKLKKVAATRPTKNALSSQDVVPRSTRRGPASS
jgi:hypothetical protein